MRATTVIWVPGPWSDPAMVQVELDGLDATTLLGPPTVRLEPAPQGMADIVFASGLPGSFPVEARAPIQEARGCVFIEDLAGGGEIRAAAMMRLVQALLDMGGLAVKVESSGRSHSPRQWRSLNPQDAVDRMRAFVTLIGNAIDGYASCGMQNLGFPDVTLPGSTPPGEAATVLTSFNTMQLLDRALSGKNAIWNGYRMTRGRSRYTANSVVHNPFGEWRLRPM